MATDGQKPEDLGVESLVSQQSENQNENSHFAVPLWTESLQQNNIHYPTPINESQKNTNSQFSTPPENQPHFQQNFTQIRPLETSCYVSPATFSEVLNSQQSEVLLQNIQDGGRITIQDSRAVNVQNGRHQTLQDGVQHNFQDSRPLNVYTQIPGSEGSTVSVGPYPGILSTSTVPSISESPNHATYGYPKMIPEEPIPLSYTELLSSVQNSTENNKMVSQTSTASDCQVLDVPRTETASSSQKVGISQIDTPCYSQDVGVSQVESANYSQNGSNPTKDLNTTQIEPVIESKQGNELAGIVPEAESKDTQTAEVESEVVPVKLIQINPEDIDQPARKISSKNGRKKQENQRGKAGKRKLRGQDKMDDSETNRSDTLRSGKKTKRSRKKELIDTPVEYEIVKHETDLSQGETIDIESYNDVLNELNSIKDDYILLQNNLTDVEMRYNSLLSTIDSNTYKKEEDPELLSNKLISIVAGYFNKPLFSDIQVLLGENHTLYGHKLILSTRSEYWGLQHLYYINKLDLTGVRQEVGYEVMKWVYTDELDTKVDVSFMIEILHASVKYKLDSLFKRCEKGLISLININNCENLKELAEDLNCSQLTEECQQFLNVHQIAPVSPLIEDDIDEVLDDLDNEADSDFEPSIVFEEKKKKRGIKKLKGLKDKKRIKIRNKKKISSIVEKLHYKKLAEAVDEELGTKLSNRIERLELKERVLAGEKPYQCDQCGRSFAAKGNLKRHISMHSDDKPFQCGICRKGFKTNSEVKRHNIVHSGEKRFMCDICSMCFSAGSSLHRHMRIHRGEKPYQCEACGKSFRSSGDVTKHNLTHTGEKPYKCPVCSKPFSRTQHVKKHMGIHKRQLGQQFQENQYPDYVKVTQND